MTMSPWLPIGLLLLLGNSASAQKMESCPWLNAATAGGVLGGEAGVSVTHTPTDRAEQTNGAPGDATCEFKLLQMPANESIKIAVHSMQVHVRDLPAYIATCGAAPRKLVGVGNEAVACQLDDGAKSVIEQVVGRVRERVFVLSWSMPSNERGLSMQAVREKLQNTAEQIAGSLF